jgi:hypothetical protein
MPDTPNFGRAVIVFGLLLVTSAASAQEVPDRIRPQDVPAVEVFLNQFAEDYNSGDYLSAARGLSRRIVAGCGGVRRLADAMRRNYQMEQVEYHFSDVRPWSSEPFHADVQVREVFQDAYAGDNIQDLGFVFTYEGGWKMDELYPIGTAVFCR